MCRAVSITLTNSAKPTVGYKIINLSFMDLAVHIIQQAC